MKKKLLAGLATGFLMLGMVGTANAATIGSTFDNNLDGWTVNSNGSIVQHRLTGGNPRGYLKDALNARGQVAV